MLSRRFSVRYIPNRKMADAITAAVEHAEAGIDRVQAMNVVVRVPGAHGFAGAARDRRGHWWGKRGSVVTGVQTCALPICRSAGDDSDVEQQPNRMNAESAKGSIPKSGTMHAIQTIQRTLHTK